MARKGMMIGKGSGYKNVIAKDPRVHSDSARGMKQAQKVPYTASVNLHSYPIKAETNKVPDIKIERIGGDVNWEKYGGQFIVDEKFNNGEFDYYLIIDFINVAEATGDEMEKPYAVEISAVAPSELSKEQINGAFESMGVDTPEERKRIMEDKKALAGILAEYGLKANMYGESGKDSKELMNNAKKQIPSITGLFGFYMDKRMNAIGNTGWDFIKGDIGFKK